MHILAKVVRLIAATVGAFALLLSLFLAWRGIADHLMQVRNHWERYCADVWLPCAVLSIISIFVAFGSLVAYRRITAWEHRLPAAPEV